jgi:hypothetical protein
VNPHYVITLGRSQSYNINQMITISCLLLIKSTYVTVEETRGLAVTQKSHDREVQTTDCLSCTIHLDQIMENKINHLALLHVL